MLKYNGQTYGWTECSIHFTMRIRVWFRLSNHKIQNVSVSYLIYNTICLLYLKSRDGLEDNMYKAKASGL